MATAANLTLKNYANTDVTYKVMDVKPDQVTWIDDTAGSLLGFRQFTLGRKMPKDKANGVIRVQGKVSRPVLDATTGALTYNSIGTFELVFPAKATLAERREVHASLKSALGNAVISTVTDTFETPY